MTRAGSSGPAWRLALAALVALAVALPAGAQQAGQPPAPLAGPEGGGGGGDGIADVRFRVVDTRSWDMLNVRSGPGTSFGIVGTIPPNGTDITVLRCEPGDTGKPWCEIRWRGVAGWVSSCCIANQVNGARLDR